MNIDEAERFVTRSQQFWWRRQKLAPRIHATLLGRILGGAAFLIFSFAVTSFLIYGHSRLIWYPAMAISYLLSWRGFRYYRVRHLFEQAGPQSFEQLRGLGERTPTARAEARTPEQPEKTLELLSH